jgi:ATP-dependent RNA helicase DDX42
MNFEWNLFRGTRDDIDEEDDQESYFRWLEENPNAGLPIADDDDEDRELQYDDDGIFRIDFLF